MEDKNMMDTETLTENKGKKKFSFKLPNFKNKAQFKRGGYAIMITAVVLVGIVAFNILVSALSNRFMLVYDMTADKVNTIDEKNIAYIKNIEKEINITVCAKEEDYSENMVYYSQEYGINDQYGDYVDYYNQTVSLIKLYNKYNDDIKVDFVDTQDASFSKIMEKYSNESLHYGDIIVSAKYDDTERYKIIGYEDIYKLYTDESMYQYYGYATTILEGNNIETALTGAIAYVNTTEKKQVAFLTGHSKEDISQSYRELLEDNNYIVDVISDEVVNEISDKYDAIFIIGPTKDFLEDEINAISNYLDNGEKYDKGLVFVASASSPYMENIYGFLEEWGIEISDGILFETDPTYHLQDTPTVMYSGAVAEDEIVNGMSLCVSGYNVPISQAFTESGDKKVEPFYTTSSSVVAAPKGVSDKWNGAEEYETSTFATIIQSQRSAYDKNNNLIKNNIIVLSSTDFVYSDLSEYSQLSNKNMVFAVAERAVLAEDTGISFVTKTITDQSFSTEVTETAENRIKWIFMILLPLACIIVGTVVYIRRRNA